MALSAVQQKALATAIGTTGKDAAAQIAQAVADSGTAGSVPSSGGLLTLGTAVTDTVSVIGIQQANSSAALTAFAGGGQASATQIVGNYARVATVATAADSVKLPSTAGVTATSSLECTVVNDGVASMQVFGSGTDTINGVATATGVPQAAGSTVKYICFVSGNWETSVASIPANLDNTVTTGTGTMVAGAMEGAQYVTLRASGQGAITLTTRTAAQIQAQMPTWKVGGSYKLLIVNNNTGTLTTAGGANVTMTSTIPAGYWSEYTVTFATATTITTTQIASGPLVANEGAQFATGTTTTTFTAGQLTPATPAQNIVVYTNTQATPGSIATRTAAQMFGDVTGAQIGQSYLLRVINGQGTGTLTITAGANVTLTGTATVAINTWRDFIVTFNSATTLTIQNAGTGTFS